MRLENYLLYEIEAGHARNMEALFRGWDEEIAAAAKALEDQKKKHLAQDVVGAAQAAWIGQLIQGLVSQAASSGRDDISVSIPGNLGVEGLIGGTSVSELNSLIAEIETIDNAQTGAIDALRNGTVPKDRDVADLFGALKVELSSRTGDHGAAIDNLGAWEQVFRAHDAQLANLGRPADPQMQIYVGAQRLEIVHASVKLLEAHRPDRTLRLIGNPKSLLEDPSKIGAPPSIERGIAPKMGREGFNRMLNSLPWVA